MAEPDAPVGTQQGVKPDFHTVLLQGLLGASNTLARARKKSAEAFLLAKVRSTKPTDRQAEAAAEVEAGAELLAAETLYFIAREQYAAALRRGGF